MRKYKAKRTVFPYVLLYDAAYYSLQEANQIQVGSFFKLMASMLFSTFCLEGYINYLGEIAIPNWNKIERNLGREKRLQMLLQHLRLNPSLTRRPFSTYSEMFRFRDSLVHSRVDRLSAEGAMKSKQKRPPYPLSTWEQSIDGKTAQRFLDDTKKIIIRLHEKTGLKKNPFSTPWVAEWEIQQ